MIDRFALSVFLIVLADVLLWDVGREVWDSMDDEPW